MIDRQTLRPLKPPLELYLWGKSQAFEKIFAEKIRKNGIYRTGINRLHRIAAGPIKPESNGISVGFQPI